MTSCKQPSPGLGQKITAGRTRIPRQVASFQEFREAMLESLGDKPAFSTWRPRSGDLGVMLVEMWAYVCDVLSFYDETVAHECYLRTARLRPSIRKLVELTGYRPRPAVASEVELVATAEGRHPVRLPPAMAFRSGGFDGNPPQVFETEDEFSIHALYNSWDIEPQRAGLEFETLDPLSTFHQEVRMARLRPQIRRPLDRARYWPRQAVASKVEHVSTEGALSSMHVPTAMAFRSGGANGYTPQITKSDAMPDVGAFRAGLPFITQNTVSAIYLEDGTARMEEGDLLLLEIRGQTASTAARVESKSNVADVAGSSYVRIDLIQPVMLPRATKASEIRVKRPRQRALLQSQVGKGAIQHDGDHTLVSLDGVYRDIAPGDTVLFTRGEEIRCAKVAGVNTLPVLIKHPEATSVEVSIRAPGGPSVQLKLTGLLKDEEEKVWPTTDSNSITAYFDFEEAGVVTTVPLPEVSYQDVLQILGPTQEPSSMRRPKDFFLRDENETAIRVTGVLDHGEQVFRHDPVSRWKRELVSPVRLHANLVKATRGERVKGEVLGSGNAATMHQSFKLKKSPLTYLATPAARNDWALRSTLRVFVNSVEWSLVSSFLLQGPADQVYTVRHDDEDNTIVTFGDGQHGSRIPTGKNNVTAHYRFGAGQASPPPGSINQIVSSVKGLSSVDNPKAAAGGENAESGKSIRSNAPLSALMLDRAVSLQDVEAITKRFPGVRTSRAEWRWSGRKQRPVIRVWYLGSVAIKDSLLKRLRSVSGPGVVYEVEQAQRESVELLISLDIEDRFIKEDIKRAVTERLLVQEDSILMPENAGIGSTFFRSRLFGEVMDIPGVRSITSISWNGDSFIEVAKTLAVGHYFDFALVEVR